MCKRTKIVATIGPACDSAERILELAGAGVDMFRVNFSHGDERQRAAAIRHVRSAEARLGRPLALCADLCGPKIRVGLIEGNELRLEPGHSLVICRQPIVGHAGRISTTLPELVDAVHAGEIILLADGRLRLEVVSVQPPDQFTCRVREGGILTSGKGVNLPQTQLRIGALTEKDLRDVEWIAHQDFDFVALSFVQRADDVRQLRALLQQRGSRAQIIAKIEKPQAIDHIDAIIDDADAIMVARGDLGVEMDFPSVPITQKAIAHGCERVGKPCIVATEMLESMVQAPRPTRAEVSDVANAVFDRADAVMLSAESAIGRYPVAAVSAMKRTVKAADDYQDQHAPEVRMALHHADTTAALAGALHAIMQMCPIAAVAVFTVSGTTARLIAKNRPPCPILALSANVGALRRCCLYRGVIPHAIATPRDTADAVRAAAAACRQLGLAEPGQRVIVLAGHPFDVPGNTNGLIVMRIGD